GWISTGSSQKGAKMQPALSYPSKAGAHWHECVADREWLRFCRLLPRLLRHRLFLDADQRLAVGAVEDIDPAGLTRLGDTLSRLAIDHRVEQDDRAHRIIVPEVMVDLLEMPDIFSGLGLERDDRGAK